MRVGECTHVEGKRRKEGRGMWLGGGREEFYLKTKWLDQIRQSFISK